MSIDPIKFESPAGRHFGYLTGISTLGGVPASHIGMESDLRNIGRGTVREVAASEYVSFSKARQSIPATTQTRTKFTDLPYAARQNGRVFVPTFRPFLLDPAPETKMYNLTVCQRTTPHGRFMVNTRNEGRDHYSNCSECFFSSI